MGNNTIVINREDGVSKVIETLNQFVRNGDYVFRGYEKQSELLPNIMRDSGFANSEFANSEKELLYLFERYGSNYFSATTAIDFMSYGQHFGIPTRLLDFTFNPFIALFFSLYKDKGTNYEEDEDKYYYYIRYASLKDNIRIPDIPLNTSFTGNDKTRISSLSELSCKEIKVIEKLFDQNFHGVINFYEGLDIFESIDSIRKKASDQVIVFVTPNFSNQRIIMQQGLFMLPYTLNKDRHLEILNKNSMIVKIHKDLRRELIQYLDAIGFNTFRLMPDLNSVCGGIRRKIKEGF